MSHIHDAPLLSPSLATLQFKLVAREHGKRGWFTVRFLWAGLPRCNDGLVGEITSWYLVRTSSQPMLIGESERPHVVSSDFKGFGNPLCLAYSTRSRMASVRKIKSRGGTSLRISLHLALQKLPACARPGMDERKENKVMLQDECSGGGWRQARCVAPMVLARRHASCESFAMYKGDSKERIRYYNWLVTNVVVFLQGDFYEISCLIMMHPSKRSLNDSFFASLVR